MKMAANDRRVVQDDSSRGNRPVDHVVWRREGRQVMAASLRVRDDEGGRIRSTSGPPGALDVVRRRRRNVAQQDGLDVADIDSEFERRRAAQDVDAATNELI